MHSSMTATIKYNKYDISLFLIIVSTIYGNYGLFHPTTILSICFFPQLINHSYLFKLKTIKPFVSFFLLWIVYALVSYSWTPLVSNGNRGMLSLLINSIIFLEILVFATKANHPIRIIVNAWVCAFLLTSVIALGEITLNYHLPSARIESDEFVETRGDEYASVTFYNPNTYCYFMCLTFPFILYKLSQCKSKGGYLVNIGIVLLIIYIMSRNSSRGGLLTLLIMITTYYIFKIKGGSYRKRLFLLLGLLVIIILFIQYGELLFSTLFLRMSQKGLLEDNARLVLWYSSWLSFVDSYGFGTGVGSMRYVLGHTNENTLTIVYSHNMILEILLEYGVIIVTGLLLFLMKLYKNAKRITDKTCKAIVIGSLLSFPFYSVINSENLTPFFIWVFFATIYVISNSDLNNRSIDESAICDKRISLG